MPTHNNKILCFFVDKFLNKYAKKIANASPTKVKIKWKAPYGFGVSICHAVHLKNSAIKITVCFILYKIFYSENTFLSNVNKQNILFKLSNSINCCFVRYIFMIIIKKQPIRLLILFVYCLKLIFI